MTPPRARDWQALLPVAAGLLWLTAPQPGAVVLGLLPALLLIGGGLAIWLRLHPPRGVGFVAAGGILGALLSLPGWALLAPWRALDSGVLAAASFLFAGRVALELQSRPVGVPAPPRGWKTQAKAALDAALVAYFVGTAKLPSGRALAASAERLRGLLEALQREPALTAALCAAPPAAGDSRSQSRRGVGFTYQQVVFDSGFRAPAALGPPPRWLEAEPNRRACAWVFRQARAGRPWLLGIHGYRMGLAWMDLRLFPPAELFERRGYNLVLPTLPLHGARRVGRRSGDGYLDGEPADLLFAQAQALWDLRRWLAWIRQQEPAARIGVVGYSLGGYNAALLAAHEAELAFVAAGIPVSDFATMLWNHLPSPHHDYLAAHGIGADEYRALLRPVSPLNLRPRLASERLAIFAGTADQVVPPAQPLALARHWSIAVHWFPGGHLSFRGEPAVAAALRRVRRAAGWDADEGDAAGAATLAADRLQNSPQ